MSTHCKITCTWVGTMSTFSVPPYSDFCCVKLPRIAPVPTFHSAAYPHCVMATLIAFAIAVGKVASSPKPGHSGSIVKAWIVGSVMGRGMGNGEWTGDGMGMGMDREWDGMGDGDGDGTGASRRRVFPASVPNLILDLCACALSRAQSIFMCVYHKLYSGKVRIDTDLGTLQPSTHGYCALHIHRYILITAICNRDVEGSTVLLAVECRGLYTRRGLWQLTVSTRAVNCTVLYSLQHTELHYTYKEGWLSKMRKVTEDKRLPLCLSS